MLAELAERLALPLPRCVPEGLSSKKQAGMRPSSVTSFPTFVFLYKTGPVMQSPHQSPSFLPSSEKKRL